MAKIESAIDEEAEGDFTSMIDVVFLLLIFFILQPFKDPDMRVLAYLPKDSGASSSTPEEIKPTIQLRILGNKDKVTFMLDDDRVSDGNYLASGLLRKSGGDTEVPVALGPAPQVNFKHVLKALDQCAMAGMEKVNFTANFHH
ncbi:MAG: ExbD/TolR family protein [Planctomycetota bacterium]|jgi:biopolymer transport protein ExbD